MKTFIKLSERLPPDNRDIIAVRLGKSSWTYGIEFHVLPGDELEWEIDTKKDLDLWAWTPYDIELDASLRSLNKELYKLYNDRDWLPINYDTFLERTIKILTGIFN